MKMVFSESVLNIILHRVATLVTKFTVLLEPSYTINLSQKLKKGMATSQNPQPSPFLASLASGSSEDKCRGILVVRSLNCAIIQ